MGLIQSVRKEWYRLSTGRRLAKNEWRGNYWYEQDDSRSVPCRRCPKFDARRQICGVPFGTPLRKCVVASLESHLHATRGQSTLEIGYGSRSLARRVVELAGGSWTGLEPTAAAGDTPVRIGAGGYGHAGSIPFADETFDFVFGIQSLEHWEERHASIPVASSYAACLREVWRVLKPRGSIYFDVPIHLHGHEMFVLGDLPRIRSLFDPELWADLTLERWRYDYAPLPRYATPEKEVKAWPPDLERRMREQVAAGGQAADSVWLLAIAATKRGGGAASATRETSAA